MDLLGLLTHGELTVEGRLTVASNVTLVGQVEHGERSARCVYKPVAGERPLWDFPDGTLAHREVAAYLVSEVVGWHVVPPTVLREDGPFGPGMCQVWLDQAAEHTAEHTAARAGVTWVDVVSPGEVPEGALVVLEAMDAAGEPVLLIHADHPALRRLALFDVVVNNADRKGGHVLDGMPEVAERMSAVVGVDHGVSFHEEPKLRTVLWGWAGSSLTDAERGDLERLREQVRGELGAQLGSLLSEDEVAALARRVTDLLQEGRFPEPTGRMPVPWPVF